MSSPLTSAEFYHLYEFSKYLAHDPDYQPTVSQIFAMDKAKKRGLPFLAPSDTQGLLKKLDPLGTIRKIVYWESRFRSEDPEIDKFEEAFADYFKLDESRRGDEKEKQRLIEKVRRIKGVNWLS